MNDLPIVYFDSESAWETWLEENHDTSQGLWLKLGKKSAKEPSINYPQALDIALCYGWIDGQKRKFDDDFWIQRFTPRRKNSKWSQVNRDKISALIAQDRMKPAGVAEVERAKADGRWESAYASQSKMEVPDDFQAELDKNPDAQAFFNQITSANRFAFLYRITTAKKEVTRKKWIDKAILMLNAKETFH